MTNTTDYKKYSPLFDKIDEAIKKNEKLTIAIEGKCGSGKTYLSNILLNKYNCNIFHMDDFFLREEQRTEDRMKEIGGNVDYERFLDEVLKPLENNEPFSYKTFSCKTMSLEDTINVEPKNLNIIEGSYSLHPTLEKYYDLKVFINIDETTQIKRLTKRCNDFLLNKFITEWIPKENIYFETFKVKDKSDIII